MPLTSASPVTVNSSRITPVVKLAVIALIEVKLPVLPVTVVPVTVVKPAVPPVKVVN